LRFEPFFRWINSRTRAGSAASSSRSLAFRASVRRLEIDAPTKQIGVRTKVVCLIDDLECEKDLTGPTFFGEQ